MAGNNERKPEACSPEPALVICGDDPRAKMYDRIVETHKRIVEAKWRAQTAGKKIQLTGNLLMHHEDAIAFLAEEVLKLQLQVDRLEGEKVGPAIDDA